MATNAHSTSFYPGPSQVYAQVEGYLANAFHSGMLSANHRSAPFMDLYQNTVALFREKLLLPQDYQIFFTGSATECWEIISQSITGTGTTLHLHNGAFGQKWYEYSKKLVAQQATEYAFGLNEAPDIEKIAPSDVLCITQNETSNGSQIPMPLLRKIRAQSDALIAVDAVSSMAGISFDWLQADIWLASVQKCFGLPAGLGLLICGPRAIDRAHQVAENNHYNSLRFIEKNAANYQTAYTPNVLGIYLLHSVLGQLPSISGTDHLLTRRAERYYSFFEKKPGFHALISQKDLRSQTVVVVGAEPAKITALRAATEKAGLILGKGYGPWAQSTFRIANFPAISEQAIDALLEIIDTFE